MAGKLLTRPLRWFKSRQTGDPVAEFGIKGVTVFCCFARKGGKRKGFGEAILKNRWPRAKGIPQASELPRTVFVYSQKREGKGSRELVGAKNLCAPGRNRFQEGGHQEKVLVQPRAESNVGWGAHPSYFRNSSKVWV